MTTTVRFTVILQALWFGLFVVRFNSNLQAESMQGCPVWEDRSGPGNNKSIYESNTGGMREGVLFCSFPLTPCYLLNSLSQATRSQSQSGHHSPPQLQVKGHRMKCTVITHILVFGKKQSGTYPLSMFNFYTWAGLDCVTLLHNNSCIP